MHYISSIILGLIFSLNTFGQDSFPERKISNQDSILLRIFWTDFKNAIQNHDKVKLAGLSKFPFYCSPCVEDSTLKHNNHITIKVTKTIFYESQYKELFSQPVKDIIEKYKDFETYIFSPDLNEKNRLEGFKFSYTIVAPSKEWEGMQGFIHLKKIEGKYKINGIDTVP